MKTEWWYDDATFHYSRGTELFFARLTVRDDGTAQLLTVEQVLEFENETGASIWLLDEEYRRLDDLIADQSEDGRAMDPQIAAPTATSQDELLRQMAIKLPPRNALTEIG
jgi:hypothetical protein